MQAVNTKNQCFVVWSDEIEGRIDPHFYKPEFIETERILSRSKYKIIKFGEIIKSITNGLDYRKFSDEEGLIYLRVANVKPFGFSLEDAKKVKINLNELIKDIKLKKGNLLITRKGTFGIALAVKEDLDYIISSEIFRIELAQNVNPNYLEIILNSGICQRQFNKIKIGGIMGSLSQEAVKSIKIPLPPLQIQNQIVEIMQTAYKEKAEKEAEAEKLLNSIDDYVLDELGIKMPEIKDKMCFSVDSELLRDNRIDANYHQVKFKEIKKSIEEGKYELIKIGEVLETVNNGVEVGSKSYTLEGIPFVRVADIDDYKINLDTNKKISPILYQKLKSEYKPKLNELLYSKDGTIGLCVMVDKEMDFIISSGILRLKTKKEVNNFYLKTILSNKIFKLLAESESIGQIIKHLLPEKLLNIKIPLPSFEIQTKIANEVKNRIEKAKKLKEEAKNIVENAKKEVEKIILSK